MSEPSVHPSAARGASLPGRGRRRPHPRADPRRRVQAGGAPRRGEDRRAAQHQSRAGPRGVQAAAGRGPPEGGAATRHVRREPHGARRARDLRAPGRARGPGRSHDRAGQRPATLARLRALADEIDRAVDAGDAVAASRADLAFHEGLCELCGNTRIHEVFMRYVPTLRGSAAPRRAGTAVARRDLAAAPAVRGRHRGRRRGAGRPTAERARGARRRADRRRARLERLNARTRRASLSYGWVNDPGSLAATVNG